MNLTAQDLMEFGFSTKKNENKKKVFIHNKLGLTLWCDKKISKNGYTDGQKPIYYSDIVELIFANDLKKKGNAFKAGLPERNLRQGNFEKAFSRIGINGKFFKADLAERILKALFNLKISSALMRTTTSGKYGSYVTENYDYSIVKTSYSFYSNSSIDNNYEAIYLHFYYKDIKESHEFQLTDCVYMIRNNPKKPEPMYVINERISAEIPVKLLLEAFETN